MGPRFVSRLARVGAALVERLGGPKIGGGLPVGVVPPLFEIEAWLNTSNGELIELDSLRGQPVFIEFWSTQCAPCVATVDKVRRAHAGYFSRGVQMASVHVNLHDPSPDVNSIEKFLHDHSISYPVGLDQSGTVWERFAFTHVPHGLLIDANGKVQWSGSLFIHDVEEVLTRFHGAPAPINECPAFVTDSGALVQGAPECKGGVCPIPTQERRE